MLTIQLRDKSLVSSITPPHSSVAEESACSSGYLGSIPRSGRFHGEGNGNPLQYSWLENPMDRGAWQATVHGVSRVRHDLATKSHHHLPSAHISLLGLL